MKDRRISTWWLVVILVIAIFALIYVARFVPPQTP
jgi:hypothetical protein